MSYVKLDQPLKARQADENVEFFIEDNKPPVIIDEVQYAPNLFRFLKIHIDENRNKTGQFLLTGSQKFSLMKGVSESLAGRLSIINLYTLSARELGNHFKQKASSSQILDRIIKGGYPEIYEHNLNP